MSIDIVNVNMAKKKLQLRRLNSTTSLFTTLWKGEVLMCYFNRVEKAITNVFCLQILDEQDINELENIIKETLDLDK
jgi:hypothetical protein